mmetsp:Transcript_27570/g.92191  ORF Transcript_27570/g.92191 Transcript_27570/m.92191 type:complete len:294 (+) Transcript_27570:745-1626(+)
MGVAAGAPRALHPGALRPAARGGRRALPGVRPLLRGGPPLALPGPVPRRPWTLCGTLRGLPHLRHAPGCPPSGRAAGAGRAHTHAHEAQGAAAEAHVPAPTGQGGGPRGHRRRLRHRGHRHPPAHEPRAPPARARVRRPPRPRFHGELPALQPHLRRRHPGDRAAPRVGGVLRRGPRACGGSRRRGRGWPRGAPRPRAAGRGRVRVFGTRDHARVGLIAPGRAPTGHRARDRRPRAGCARGCARHGAPALPADQQDDARGLRGCVTAVLSGHPRLTMGPAMHARPWRGAARTQ